MTHAGRATTARGGTGSVSTTRADDDPAYRDCPEVTTIMDATAKEFKKAGDYAPPYSAEGGEEPQLGSPSTENGGEKLPTERAGGPASHKWSRRLRPRDKLHPPERVAQLAVTEEGSPVVDDHHPLSVCVRDYRVRCLPNEQSEVPVEQNREDEPRTTRPQQWEM